MRCSWTICTGPTRYTVLARDQAVEVFAYGEAERHFRMAVELATSGSSTLADTPLGSEALAKFGRVLDMSERYDEALEVLEQAAEVYRMQGNLAAEGLVVSEIGWLQHNRDSDEEGLARVQAVVAALEQERASALQQRALAALYTGLARLFFGLGRLSDELAAAERAVCLSQDLGDPLLLAVAEGRWGAALMGVGRRGKAREALERAITLSEATGNLGTLTVALDNLGEIARDGGDYRQAQRDSNAPLSWRNRLGSPAGSAGR